MDVSLMEHVLRESARTLDCIKDTEQGSSHEWKNVQKSVLDSNRQLHQAIQLFSGRIDALENTVEQLSLAVHTLIDDRRVKEERYTADQRLLSRSLQTVTDDLHTLRNHLRAIEGTVSEDVHTLRDSVFAEVERDLAALKEVSKVQQRRENRLELCERDVDMLRKDKLDSCDFASAIREIKTQLEQLQLFPALRTELATQSSQSDMLARAGGAASRHVGSNFRWVWHGGSFASTCAKAIPWEERILKTGEAIRWNSAHGHVLKIDHEGTYHITAAVFLQGREANVPAITMYVNGDAVVAAVQTRSACLTKMASAHHSHHRRDGGVGKPCACDPVIMSGFTVTDYLYLPVGCVLTLAYGGDPRNVLHAILSIQCLS